MHAFRTITCTGTNGGVQNMDPVHGPGPGRTDPLYLETKTADMMTACTF